jgi:hypothetical protein
VSFTLWPLSFAALCPFWAYWRAALVDNGSAALAPDGVWILVPVGGGARDHAAVEILCPRSVKDEPKVTAGDGVWFAWPDYWLGIHSGW